MQRLDWVEHRLQNWARRRLMGGDGPGLGYAAVKWGDTQAGRSGYRETVIPVNAVEASETDTAVAHLQPGGLRLAVVAVYCGSGSMEDRAAELGVAASTLYQRVAQAHQQLAGHWLAQQDRQREERSRVQALIRRARPGSFTP